MNGNVLTPLRSGAREREDLCNSYRQYLLDRDGVPDATWSSLHRRDDGLARHSAAKVRFDGPVDADLFRAQYLSYSPRRETSTGLLLLLAYVKVNANEVYAVDTLMASGCLISDIERLVLLEETYHTKLLLGASDRYGLSVPGAARPPAALRMLINLITRLPVSMRHPLALAGEILGIAVFTRLLEATRVALDDQPALRDALEARVMEVFVDELGHLSYNRLLVNDTGMEATRRLLPLILIGFQDAYPELDRILGRSLSVEDLTSVRFDAMPEEVRSKGFAA